MLKYKPDHDTLLLKKTKTKKKPAMVSQFTYHQSQVLTLAYRAFLDQIHYFSEFPSYQDPLPHSIHMSPPCCSSNVPRTLQPSNLGKGYSFHWDSLFPSFFLILYDQLPYFFQICVQKSLSQWSLPNHIRHKEENLLCFIAHYKYPNITTTYPFYCLNPQSYHQLVYAPVNTLVEGSANYVPLATSCLCKLSFIGT